MHPLVRVVGVVALLAAVVGLGVHYDAAFASHSPYPESDALATDYESHVGEEAFLIGTVQTIDGDGDRATVRFESDEGTFALRVRGVTERVQPGGAVQVHGTLEADHAMTARTVAVVNPAGASKRYKYGVSAVGAVLVLAVFFRHWRFDTDSLGFEVRSDG